MSKIMNENANVVNPEHAIDHNSFGGIAYFPVRNPSDLRSPTLFRLMKNER